MNSTQKWLLGAGALILVLTNAVALIGVAYNRMGPPDSVFTLTERELNSHWDWMWSNKENSALNVELFFRTETAPGTVSDQAEGRETFSTYGGLDTAVRWLDRKKLAALGFNIDPAPSAPDDQQRNDRLLERDVLLVLELDGPASQRALQNARDRVAYLARQAVDDAEDKKIAQSMRGARESLEQEEQNESRLFIIDAGLDENSLRQQYSDRTHYAIVRGSVRPVFVWTGKSSKLYGMVTAVHCQSIHVPLLFRSTFAAANFARAGSPAWRRDVAKKPLTVQVAFGRRLEPWILAAQVGGP